MQDFSGTLTASDGTIGGRGPQASLDGRLSGTLTGGGDVVGVDTALRGALLGPDAEGLQVSSPLGSLGNVSLNGVPVGASGVVIVAERR